MAMLDPNRFRTSPFGCPAANAVNFVISEFIQIAATTSLSATKPYPPRDVGSAKRNERNPEVKSKYPLIPTPSGPIEMPIADDPNFPEI